MPLIFCRFIIQFNYFLVQSLNSLCREGEVYSQAELRVEAGDPAWGSAAPHAVTLDSTTDHCVRECRCEPRAAAVPAPTWCCRRGCWLPGRSPHTGLCYPGDRSAGPGSWARQLVAEWAKVKSVSLAQSLAIPALVCADAVGRVGGTRISRRPGLPDVLQVRLGLQ